MPSVPAHLPFAHLLRRLLPALGGFLLFWCLVFSLSAGAAGQNVDPEALGSLSGTVTNAASQPVSGVEVTVYRPGENYSWVPIRTVTTTAAGRYVVPALRTGFYHLSLRDPQGAYAPVYYEHSPTLGGGRDVPVAGNEVTGLDVQLEPPASLTGAVTIVDDIVPKAAFVTIYGQDEDAWEVVTTTWATTLTGAYAFPRLLAGTYRVCASGTLGGYYSDSFSGCYGGATPEVARSITVTTGGSVANLDFQLSEGQFEGQITGTVTSDGLPLAGIQVSLHSSSPMFYTYTNAAGTYQFGGLQDGEYRVVFSDPAGDYVTRYYPESSGSLVPFLSLRGGATISNANAIMPRAGAISGQIHFVSGWPTDTVHASLYQLTDGDWEAYNYYPPLEIGATGNYRIKLLEPGTYRLCMPFALSDWRYYPNCYGTDRSSDLYAAADITVVAGVTTSGIDFTIGPAPVYLPAIHHQVVTLDALAADGRFSMLVDALQASGVSSLLQGSALYTIFAPTDAAFDALPEGAFEQLLADPTSQMTEILHYHLVGGKLLSADISNGLTVTTLQGRPVRFEVQGNSSKINGGNVIESDLVTANGVIHVIDAVILPPPE